MTGVRVYLRHARQAGAGQRVTCAPGIRAWCERNGVDLREIASEGIPVERIAAIPDHFAQRAAQIAIAEAARG